MLLRQLFHFSISSFAASIIDIGIFTLLNMRLGSLFPASSRLLIATGAARTISALCNYIFNHKAVFQSKQTHAKALTRYAGVACVQMATSYFIVFALSSIFEKTAIWDTGFKVLADIALFFVSFHIQRKWIFK